MKWQERALSFAESLRKKQGAVGDVSFVPPCRDNPQSVGRAPVSRVPDRLNAMPRSKTAWAA